MEATGPTVSAEIRRKHIMTLEVCQRLIDENQSLRGDNPPSKSPPPRERPEDTSSGLRESLKLIESRLKASDRRAQLLEAQSEGDRIVLCESRAECHRLELEVERLRDLSESQLATIGNLERTNTEFSANAHRAAEEVDQLRKAATLTPSASVFTTQAAVRDRGDSEITASWTPCSVCEHTRDTCKAKADEAQAACEALVQQVEADALEHAAMLRTAQAESERLRAENSALELEVRRLSMALQSCTSREQVMQKQLDEQKLELTRLDQQRQSQVAEEQAAESGLRATSADSIPQQLAIKSRFTEFSELQKENQLLKRQIGEFEAARARSGGAAAQLPRPLQRSKSGKVALPVFGQPPARR